MKKTILLFAWLLISHLVYSQRSQSYKIVEDNPENYKRTSLVIDVTDVEMCRGVALGYGLSLQTHIADFVPVISFRKAYVDGNAYGDTRDIEPGAGMTKFSSLELGTTWFFAKTRKTRTVQLNLSGSKMGNYTYVTYINIPNVSENTYHGLDLGFMTQNRGLSLEVEFDDPPSNIWQYERVSDAFTAPVSGFQRGVVFPEGFYSSPRTNYRLNTFYVGYRQRITQHLEVLLDGAYSAATKDVYLDWYAHLLISPSSKLKSLEDTDGVAWNLVPVSSAKTFDNLGFRVGCKVIFASIMDVHTELGYMTGFKANESALGGLCWNVGFGVFIGSRFGFLKK